MLHTHFCSLHSTETALVKVTNDLQLATDAGMCSLFIHLDLSSAFDTMDHNQFISYLSNGFFSVMLGDLASLHAPLFCGIPQQSILAALLFTIHVTPGQNHAQT